MDKKVLVINGPNINMLGRREKDLYGKEDYNYLCEIINKKAKELGYLVEMYQSNSEGSIITKIQNSLDEFDDIIINPAAYTHTSIGILDALKMFKGRIICLLYTSWLGENYWNKGIVTEAVKIIVKEAFERFDIVRINAEIFSDNVSSKRVLEKAGFKFEGVKEKSIYKNGVLKDSLLYAYIE